MNGEASNVDKQELAKEKMEISLSRMEYTLARGNISADNFSTLEAQVAAVIFAFLGAFSGLENTDPLIIRKLFFLGILSLVGSLAFGLINFNVVQRFWKNSTQIQHKIASRWISVRNREKDFDSAKSEIQAILEVCGESSKSANWPWITQTTLLSLGIILILTSFYLRLFP